MEKGGVLWGFCSELFILHTCQAAEDCGLVGVAEREAEKQRLLGHSSELNFEKEALEQRAADLSAALVVGIATTYY
jgi:hypothetical protein